MVFSETAAQQRDQQEQKLKRFLTYSLLGSFVLHGVGLGLKVGALWQLDAAVLEEITIVVTDPLAVDTVEPMSPEVRAADAIAEPEPMAEPEASGVATIVDAPQTLDRPPHTLDVAAASASPPAPLTADPEAPVTETPIGAKPDPDVAAADAEVVPEPTEPRDLSDLLAELRRAREQARQPRSGSTGRPDRHDVTGSMGNGADPGDRPATTATAPTRPGTGRNSGSRSGRETEATTAPGARERSSRDQRSREITCRGCDFDYPVEADGVEGTAQVVVETDNRGRVVSVTLSRSSGNAALDRAALEQARRRIRLNNARAGESYPIDVDFVQPNSAAAERARARGERRSITVSDPEPETPAASETGASATMSDPASSSTPTSSATAESSSGSDVEPSGDSASEATSNPEVAPTPSSTLDVEPAANSAPSEPVSAPAPEPVAPASPPPAPAPELDES